MTTSDFIEQAAVPLFRELGWEIVDCRGEVFGPDGLLGRDTKSDVVLLGRLVPALRVINPRATAGSLALAEEELLRDRSSLPLVEANREIHQLLAEGFHVGASTGRGGKRGEEVVRYVDWDYPEANDFVLARGFGVTGERSTHRCDLVGFVNGIPLVVGELKRVHRDLGGTFERTLALWQKEIPHLFRYNSLLMVSNGRESRIGPVGAAWTEFGEWKRVAVEEEAASASFETMIRGTCARDRLLDLTEGCMLFVRETGGWTKIMAKNHQHLGVNAALGSLRDLASNRGRLGMFWHAQGSGKSVSMMLFSQKVLRKVSGAWTFVIVAETAEAAGQVAGRFAAAGLLEAAPIHADGPEDLRRLLKERSRHVFMTIRQFHDGGAGAEFPLVSGRFDVVVMVAEAHGAEYEGAAANMRTALPNAAFVGFTGTPLLVGEDNTRRVFGDYVSIYNFRESVEDGVTVPLYYENRVPEVQIPGGGLDKSMEQILREAELDERRESRLESECKSLYYLITDDDRLETVARDIVKHFVSRGHLGKAIVVCVDRITAVRMYEKVHGYWALQLASMRLQLGSDTDQRLAYWQETDMAVLLSQTIDDIEEFHKKGIDATPHVERAAAEDLGARFQDPADPLRLVFTCRGHGAALEVASCSTVYLDKPMRGHALMQTVSRANRRYHHKAAGVVIDYLGVFADPRRALAVYGAGSGGGVAAGDLPVVAKSRLVKRLRKTLSAISELLRGAGFEVEDIARTPQMLRPRLLESAVNAVLARQDRKEEFLALARQALLEYRAAVPDAAVQELAVESALIAAMLRRIRALTPEPGMSSLERRLVRLLDWAVEGHGYTARPLETPAIETGRTTSVRKLAPDDAGVFGAGEIDLSRIDYANVWKRFAHAQKNIETERLRGVVERKVNELVRLNPSRAYLRERLDESVRESFEGEIETEAFFARLVDLAQELNAETHRAAEEGLKEDELALFDLLTKKGPALIGPETEGVKTLVRGLLADLKAERLDAGWRDDAARRAVVRTCIDETLKRLPDAFPLELVAVRASAIFEHVFDSYYGGGLGVYSKA